MNIVLMMPVKVNLKKRLSLAELNTKAKNIGQIKYKQIIIPVLAGETIQNAISTRLYECFNNKNILSHANYVIVTIEKEVSDPNCLILSNYPYPYTIESISNSDIPTDIWHFYKPSNKNINEDYRELDHLDAEIIWLYLNEELEKFL